MFSSWARAGNGQHYQLTHSWMIQRMNNVLEEKGLERTWGHSFRIGGATFWLCAKIDWRIVQKLGGWSSDAFLLYWRKLRLLAARCLAEANFGNDDTEPISMNAISERDTEMTQFGDNDAEPISINASEPDKEMKNMPRKSKRKIAEPTSLATSSLKLKPKKKKKI